MTSRVPQTAWISARSRAAACAVIFCAVAITPPSARADWEDSSTIVRGSAQVLEKGEIGVGVFAPISFGLTDSVTVQSHPVLNLLRLLNVAARWRIASGKSWLVGATAGVKYAMLDPDKTDRSLELDVAGIATWLPHRRVALTASTGIAPQQNNAGITSSLDVGVALVGTAHVILHERHLLMATLRLRRDGTRQDWDVPVLTTAWISHQRFPLIGEVDLVMGMAFGSFRVRDPIFVQATPGAGYGDSWYYPVFDLWWRM